MGLFDVCAIGPLPPPVHGNSKNFEIITNQLNQRCNLLVINLSPGALDRGFRYHFVKLLRVLVGMLCLLFHRPRKVYLTLDGGAGKIYSFLFVLVGKIKGVELIIHHRNFSYANKFSRIVWLICRTVPKALHVFLGQIMVDKFNGLYNIGSNYIVTSNACFVTESFRKPIGGELALKKIKLGYISNLSDEKGFDLAVDVFRILQKLHPDKFVLIVAGPTENSDVNDRLKSYLNEFGESIDYLGAIYGEQKYLFFRDIDLLLFPTKYKDEVQPNVLLEALGFSVPVITTSRGCISEFVTHNSGFVFEEQIYINEAVRVLTNILAGDIDFEYLKSGAFEQFLKLQFYATAQHENLLNIISGE